MEWAWLAGLLDGEACFRFSGGLPRIILHMTDEDIVKRVADYLGVNYYLRKPKNPKHKDAWQLSVCKTEVVIECYFNIYKYMSKRRQERLDEFAEGWKFKGLQIPPII